MLIVETGEGLTNAESYVSVADAQAFASSRGLTIPSDESEVEILLRRATDYIDAREPYFQGSRVSAGQALAFPRSGVVINGFALDDDALPQTLKNAACQLCADFVDNNPDVIGEGREVIQETVGPISTTYAATGRDALLPVFVKADKYLLALTNFSTRPLFLRV
jgi:hypothetical protein